MEAVRLVFALRREEVCEDAGDDDEDEANDQACTVDGTTVSSKIQELLREQDTDPFAILISKALLLISTQCMCHLNLRRESAEVT